VVESTKLENIEERMEIKEKNKERRRRSLNLSNPFSIYLQALPTSNEKGKKEIALDRT